MKKVILFFFWSACSLATMAQNEEPEVKKVEYPEGFTEQLDVVYTRAANWEGMADLYLPPNSGKPTPVIINIHGGGWKNGNRKSQTGFMTWFKAGFAVANMSYRLTGQATAPAAVEDARCMIVYLITNAKALNIDPNKIVVMGGSAGGHLALMAGLLGNDRKFDSNCPCKEEVKVAAIINKYGITNVWDWAYASRVTSKSAVQWLGDKAKDEAFARSVSPMTYVNKNSPPVFIVHGDADPTVPYEMSVELHQKLKELGVPTAFITVEGGLHGKFDKEKNKEINKAMVQFIKSLKAFN